MSGQQIKPPDTWNDTKTMHEEFRMLFGWYGHKDQNAAIGAFHRGWRSGAIAATLNMWKWMQTVLFGHEECKTPIERKRNASHYEEQQIIALNMIDAASLWLAAVPGAIEESSDQDEMIEKALIRGERMLSSIREYMKTGKTPEWYE